ncbi:MAG: DUF4407 domain-containing protein [Bacteroidetes bacterium]|nr:MAG: DUF4407 domain-containing protein [Bacteroidota bacterium]
MLPGLPSKPNRICQKKLPIKIPAMTTTATTNTPRTNLVCFVTGANPLRYATSTDASRTKLKAFALAALIPTVAWALCTFLLMQQVLDAHWAMALAGAALAGFVVFTIERLVLMSNKNWIIGIFRAALAITVAFIGAQLFDLVLFKTDIDQQMPALRHQQATKAQRQAQQQYAERHGLAALAIEIDKQDSLYNERQNQAVGEASGLRGTGIKGAASATAYKDAVALRAKAATDQLKATMGQHQTAMATEQKNAYDTAYKAFNDKSLLFRMAAMHTLLAENTNMRGMYRAVTIFLFLIEFLVLIFKLCWPKTAYELETETLDEMHRQRTMRMAGTERHMHNQPHHNHPAASLPSKRLTQGAIALL